jgi:hypothetical protein
MIVRISLLACKPDGKGIPIDSAAKMFLRVSGLSRVSHAPRKPAAYFHIGSCLGQAFNPLYDYTRNRDDISELEKSADTQLHFRFRSFLCIKRDANDWWIYGKNTKGKFDK